MPLMRRRPLLRAAAVGGSAYLAGKRRGQADQPQPEPPAPAAAPPPSAAALSAQAMEQLKSLAQLHDQGILTDQEFDEQKARLLGG
jgi:hypothetical protein